jgi:hypothetical protein
MAEQPYSASESDDLPRTVRQQKEARARDQMAREILNAPRPQPASRQAQAAAAAPPSATVASPSLASDYDRAADYAPPGRLPPGEAPAATVTGFEVPFLHMVGFFLKAALAAIPAILLLTALLWVLGQLAQTYLPWLIKMRILITFPG